MTTPARATFGPGARFLVVAGAAVLVVAGLRAAAPALVPVMLALFLAAISLPLFERLRALPLPGGRRLPQGLAAAATIAAIVTVVLVLALVLTRSFRELASALPRYEQGFGRVLQGVQVWLAERGYPVGDLGLASFLGPEAALGLFRGTAATVTRVLTQLLLVVLVLAFTLLEAPRLREKLHAAFGEQSRADERVAKVAREVQVYLGVKSLTSLATGVAFGVWVALLGVDFPFLWGFLAFVLNYIPNLGSVLAAAPPTLLGLVQHGPGLALAVLLGNVVVNQVLSNLVEPHLMRRTLGLSPLAVVLSLVFWGWVWGGAGVLLAVPVTMSLKILLEHSEDLHWLATLLEARPRRAGGVPAQR